MQAGQGDPKPRALARSKPGHVQRAAALRGQEKLLTAASDAPADVFFSVAVIHGDINIIDAGIQDRVENTLGLAWRERPPHAGNHAAQLQGAKAECGHAQAGTPKYSYGEVWHVWSPLAIVGQYRSAT